MRPDIGAQEDSLKQHKLALIEDFQPALERMAEDAEREGRIPEKVVNWLYRHGFYRLWVPERYGGSQMSLPDVLAVYERAACIDGALGWAIMIGCGGGLFAAYLPDSVAADLFSHEEALVAGSGMPTGTAVPVEGGYKVSGRWRFASGIHQASIITASCRIKTSEGANTSDIVAVAMNPEQVTIVESWNTQGMRATGSHDFEACDQFVRQDHTFTLAEPLLDSESPLYRLPFKVLTDLPVAAVACGIGDRLLKEFVQLSQRKCSYHSNRHLVDSPLVMASLATARGSWLLLKNTLAEQSQRLWQQACTGEVTSALQNDCTLACSQGVIGLRRALAELIALSGMDGFDRSGRLSRAWQDYQALCAHGSLAPSAGVAVTREWIANDTDGWVSS